MTQFCAKISGQTGCVNTPPSLTKQPIGAVAMATSILTAPCSRAEAKTLGSRFYYTGRECHAGHVAPRYTSTGMCSVCISERTKSQVANGYFRELYRNNAEARLQKMRDGYPRVAKDRVRRAAEWAKNNPESRRLISISYKARRRAKEAGGISTADLAAWIKEQRKTCHWCGNSCEESFHVDHYVPLARGGKHAEENLVIACPRCNLSKGARDPLVFAEIIRGRKCEQPA